MSFLAVEATDGSGSYTYYYAVDGAHTGFPAFELYVNQVRAYSYSPLNTFLGSFAGPAGLYYPGVHPSLDYQVVPGWVLVWCQ